MNKKQFKNFMSLALVLDKLPLIGFAIMILCVMIANVSLQFAVTILAITEIIIIPLYVVTGDVTIEANIIRQMSDETQQLTIILQSLDVKAVKLLFKMCKIDYTMENNKILFHYGETEVAVDYYYKIPYDMRDVYFNGTKQSVIK